MGNATSEQVKKDAPNRSPRHPSDTPAPKTTPYAFGGVLQKSSITQLQRTHGNRFVLQMVRDAGARPPKMSPSLRGKRFIQLDRLVEFPTGKDIPDFAMTRRQVEGSLKTPSSGNWFARDAFRLASGETLYLWGHMDEERIGSLTFQEVAAHMVRNGFRGCATIRLIGCNNPIVPQAAPKKLHLALAYYLANPAQAVADNSSDSDTDNDEAIPDDGDEFDNEEEGGDPSIGHWADPATAMAATPAVAPSALASASGAAAAAPIKAPPVFATIGPLFSSGTKGFTEGWKVAVNTPKEDKRRTEQAQVLEHLKGEATFLPESELEGLVSYYSVQAGLDLKTPDESTFTKLEAYFEKEIEQLQRGIADKAGVYPTLKRPAPTASDPHNTEWNPDAWVSFP